MTAIQYVGPDGAYLDLFSPYCFPSPTGISVPWRGVKLVLSG